MYSRCWRRWAPCRRPGNSTAAACLAGKAARIRDRAGEPGSRPARSGLPPAPDQGAAPPPGSSGNTHWSSISPAYSTHIPAGGTPFPVIVGAPFCRQRTDRRLFLSCQLPAVLHAVTSHRGAGAAVPVAGHALDAPPIGAPVAAAVVRRAWGGRPRLGRFLHFTLILAVCKIQ